MIKFWLVQKVSKADKYAEVVHIYTVESNARTKARSLRRALNSNWKVQVVTLVPHVVEDIVSYSSDTLIRLAQKSR